MYLFCENVYVPCCRCGGQRAAVELFALPRDGMKMVCLGSNLLQHLPPLSLLVNPDI